MAEHQHKIEFIPNPMQKLFIESRARADLMSSRMGEGKSAALCWAAFYHTRHNPGADWFLIRDTWENIQATTQKEFFSWFPPGVMGEYHATKKVFTWASGIAQGSVGFLGMDAPEDASKLMSRPMAGFGIDEPAPAVGSVGVDEMIFDIAMSRLRQQGMKWYAAKLAENNPDEAHWTYRRFVVPGNPDFRTWQPNKPENQQNLPANYYQELRKLWAHRPDLIRRFVEGDFGFQSEGKSVTPQWSDKVHLAIGLIPTPRVELILLWDFGHNPTCIVTQKTPMGTWNILDAMVGDGIGVEELIQNEVLPLLTTRYRNHPVRHIGDPSGQTGEQTSVHRSAVRYILKVIGGTWRSGPVRLDERIEPLRAVLSRISGGRGVVQVDRDRASAVWQALRGGWHFHVARTGVTSSEPKKNIHSHPGDAVSYGAAILFPLSKFAPKSQGGGREARQAGYFAKGPSEPWRIGPTLPGKIPEHGSKL